MESKVAQTWLAAMAATANAKDYEAHMDLISKNVKVFGIPDFDVITYDAWAAQCKHEFDQNILKQVSYDGIKVLVNMPGRVMFKTMETIEATDGTVNTMAVEIVLEKETDGKWRVTQERILSPEETALDQDSGGY